VNRLTTAYSSNENGPRGAAIADLSARERMFRRATRHSQRVRFLRVALPVALVVSTAATFFVVWYNPLRMLSDLPASISGLMTAGSLMTMTEPKLSGYTHDKRRYELSATAAENITSAIVNFREPHATLEMLDQSKIDMKAAVGIFDRNANQLTLNRNIVLTSTSGYEVRLNQAVIDMKSGNIVSDQPVEVKMQQGTLQANRLEVTRSGEIIRFDGGVVMNLMPESDETRDPPKVPQ